jgi:intein-encoded DNA endonuclease-like protein
MRTKEEIKKILDYHKNGYNPSEIGRMTNIPRCTCADIINRYKNKDTENIKFKSDCDLNLINKKVYAFLLGEYLGDGHIICSKKLKNGNNVFKFRIFQDTKYPNVIKEIQSAMQIILGGCISVVKKKEENCVEIFTYSTQVATLFPQLGPGKKHNRKIVILEWQKKIIEEYPFDFLKGLIYSDGCIFLNKKSGQYWIDFTNRSEDIKEIYEEVLGSLGIMSSRNSKGLNVRVTNQLAVSALMEHIPLKS